LKRLMGIINLHNNKDVLWELTRGRPLAAVPFAGRYRLIDFALSNMINSGITTVGMLMQGNYRSLMDHLRSGKEWDLARKREGLFLLPPIAGIQPENGFPNDLSAFQSNLDYLQNSRQSHVVLSGANMVANINFSQAFDIHEARGADISIIYKEEPHLDRYPYSSMIEMDEHGRVIDMEINPARAHYRNLSLEMYIMKKSLLAELVDSASARGGINFLRDALMKNIASLKVYGIRYTGYLAHLMSIRSYYRHSMELLQPAVWRELFFANGLIYTKIKDEAPTKYNDSAKTSNSIIASGCVLEGTIENSVIFRGVKIHKGAVVRNSIIMQNTEICAGATLENMICDKNVRISAGKCLLAEPHYPMVISKGSLL